MSEHQLLWKPQFGMLLAKFCFAKIWIWTDFARWSINADAGLTLHRRFGWLWWSIIGH